MRSAAHSITIAKAASTGNPAAFHARLHAWYAMHGRRSLPWRNTRDPYRIYVSEVMLQQTQVATVLERFYFPFLAHFPTLAALARAEREEVLKAWQGLGYYSRAGNLHKAAQACDGALPETVEGLLALPGIGRNTAHAVAAFAYHQPVPVMEANVKRVLHRIFALERAGEAELWDKAEALLDRKNPFDYNQAMMDVGAMVCTRRAPQCGECPATDICRGKHAPEAYPAPKQGRKTPVRRRIIVALRDAAGRFYAEPRTERFLQGMYRFVEMQPSSRRKPGSRLLPAEQEMVNTAVQPIVARWIPAFAGMTALGEVRQQYSHFTLEAEVYMAETGGKERGNLWFTLEELKKLPHSKAEEKVIGMLEGLGIRG